MTGYAALQAGIDEAGRGALAGPVVAAAVCLDPSRPIAGLDDSKKLSARQRELLAVEIRAFALAWALGEASAEEVDDLNVLQASLLAMRRACLGLPAVPQSALVDGNRLPDLPCPAQAVIGGDAICPAIGAASILAKVERDRIMVQCDLTWPGYDFARHKGYGTRRHLTLLHHLGICPLHRRSFSPVRRIQAPALL